MSVANMGYCKKHDAYNGNGHCQLCDTDQRLDDYNAVQQFSNFGLLEFAACRLLSSKEEIDHFVAERLREIASSMGDDDERLQKAEHALISAGYRRDCDIPACNCGDRWVHGGHANERLREISNALEGRDQGITILMAVEQLMEEVKEADDE